MDPSARRRESLSGGIDGPSPEYQEPMPAEPAEHVERFVVDAPGERHHFPAQERREQLQRATLRLTLVVVLREHLATKMSSAPAFSLPSPRLMVDMLRADLKDADIPYRDDAGRCFDFHALRHQTGSLLAASGVHPKVAQTIMRHSTIGLTMDIYTHTLREDERSAVEAMPDLDDTGQSEQRATGTDDTPAPTQGDSDLAPSLAREGTEQPNLVRRGAARSAAESEQRSVRKACRMARNSDPTVGYNDPDNLRARGGTGRRSGLKIRGRATSMRVRIPPGPSRENPWRKHGTPGHGDWILDSRTRNGWAGSRSTTRVLRRFSEPRHRHLDALERHLPLGEACHLFAAGLHQA
jgi:hypothetical protein